MPLDPPSSFAAAAAAVAADPSPPTTTPSPSPNPTRPPTPIPNSTTITTPTQPATAPPPQPPQPPRPLPLPLIPTLPRPNVGPIPAHHWPGYQDPRSQQTGFPSPRSSLSSGLGFQIPPPPPPLPSPHGVVTATMNIPPGVGHHPRGGMVATGRGVGPGIGGGGGRGNGGAGRSAVFTIGNGPIKVSSSQGAGPDRNGHRDPNDRSRDDSFVTVRDRKVRFTEGTSMYALCRSWFRNGYYDGSRPKSTDIVRSLPKPLPLEVLETCSSKGPEADAEKEAEDEKSVEKLSAEELLQRLVKRAKRVRARLSEKRLQRIARYKNRLALLLPPLAEQSRNDASGGT